MPLILKDLDRLTKAAVIHFWKSRDKARNKQIESGKADQGERSSVTSGKNMDGFIEIATNIVQDNGLSEANIFLQRKQLSLPGYYRPTKLWDLLIVNQDHLVAALEFKSQVGPSFGNNFNNRAEEALGTATDFWTAFRENAFFESPRPFLGWLILVEDTQKSRTPVKDHSPHFPTFPEFQGASYLNRYDILCRKMVKEGLYTSSCLLTSSRDAVDSGDYQNPNGLISIKTFFTTLAGHIAATAMI